LAFLSHEPFYPPSGGGSAEAVYLVEEFVRRGHEVHLLGPAIPDEAAVARRFGVTIHPFTRWEMGRYTPRRNLKYLLYPGALAAHVRRTLCALQRERGADWRFDLLLAQHTISAVAAGRLRRRLQVPVFLNFLDYLTGFMETWPALFTRSGLVPMLNRFEMSLPRRYDVEGVLTVSQPLADRFVATGYPRERVQAIQYGYDRELFTPSRQPPSNPPVVVMHGSFDQHHLGTIAREAVATVAKHRPDVVFRFIGRETPGLIRFAADVKSRMPGVRLELTGFVPYAEVAARLQEASVGIVPYEESQGTHCAFVAKAVEYFGCGLPVVSTPLENLSRYFGSEPAIRFSEFRGDSFGKRILEWLAVSPEERRRIGLAVSARVAAELDWRVIARQAAEFLEAKVGSRRPF
jgi:glycosyltransferase involved in cell wall biosynthesis